MPALQQTLRFVRQPHRFLGECAARYGDAFTLRLIGLGRVAIFSHPDTIRAICELPSEDIIGGNTVFGDWLGNDSLFVLESAPHKRMRKLLMPAFHGERLRGYGEQILQIAHRAVDAWPVGVAFPVHERFRQVTLDVMLCVVFGLEEPETMKRAAETMVRAIRAASFPGLFMPIFQVDLGAWSPWAKLRRAVGELDEYLFALIAQRRATKAEGTTDVLGLFLETRDDEGQLMTDGEIRDQLVSLLLAGHESSATMLAWVVRWILTDPVLVERLVQEVHSAMPDGRLVPEAIARLPLLDATINETLRLEPVALTFNRLSARPVTIGSYRLPAKTVVMGAIHLAHRRSQAFPEPSRFRPERFFNGKPSPFEWLPFGAGYRRCIGVAFSMYEMKLILAVVLSRVTMSALRGVNIKPTREGIFIVPSQGMPVIVDAKTPAPLGHVAIDPGAQPA